jgi:hypothetical protein
VELYAAVILLKLRCHAAHYSTQRLQVQQVDEKKVMRIMGVVTAPFTIGKDRHYLSPTALRIGILFIICLSRV